MEPHGSAGLSGRILAGFFAWILVLASLSFCPCASAGGSLYDKLGLEPDAKLEDIHAAYKQQFETWRTDKQYKLAEIKQIIEIQHAYHVLSNNLTRRDYDFFGIDELQEELVQARQRYGEEVLFTDLEFPLWESKTSGQTLESTSETVTSENFGDLVLKSSDPWLIQIYSNASPDSQRFAPVWEKIVDLLDGVVKVGRVELGEIPLALVLSERNWLNGYPFFRNGLPAIVAVLPDCQRLDCWNRYYGSKTSDEITDWVATRLLKLPRILYYNSQTLVSLVSEKASMDVICDQFSKDTTLFKPWQVSEVQNMGEIIQKPGIHKVKVITFSESGERAFAFMRKAAREYREYAHFGMVLWRESEATFWETKIGVEFAPATVFLKDPGLPPTIYHGKLNASILRDLMERHKTYELQQLRSITATNLGCDASNYSLAGSETKIWYCVIVAGRAGFVLNQMRGVLRDVQDILKEKTVEDASSEFAVEAFKKKRLHLAWLDGEIQKNFCYFYLNSEDMFEACGPSRFEMKDIPKVFLIRYIRKVIGEKETKSEKKRWLPKTTWEREFEEESKYAAQLVTKYNGSSDVSEIVAWISQMIKDGENEDLPSFRGKAPDLVPEENIPFTVKTKEYAYDRIDNLLERGKAFLFMLQDFRRDPKFVPLILFIALFYSFVWLLSTRSKGTQRNQAQASDQIATSGNSAVEKTQDGDLSGNSTGREIPATSDGLRRRKEIGQSS